jgi:hypothetical protein
VPDRVARLIAVGVAVICAASLVTIATWPPYEDGSWQLQYPPAWWQLEILAGIGFWLLAAPSYVLYLLDGYFRPGSPARGVVAALLAALEIAILAFAVLSLIRFSLRRIRRGGGVSSYGQASRLRARSGGAAA